MSKLSNRQESILRTEAVIGAEYEHREGSWGEQNEDHSAEEHSRAQGRGAAKDENGTTFATREDVDRYYDSGQRTNITIRERK
jgi:hypothetical protein